MPYNPKFVYFWRKVGYEANRRAATATNQEDAFRWMRVARYAAKRYNVAVLREHNKSILEVM